MLIEFKKLVPTDNNPRKFFRSASLEEFQESIKNYWLIEPLVVRPINKNIFAKIGLLDIKRKENNHNEKLQIDESRKD